MPDFTPEELTHYPRVPIHCAHPDCPLSVEARDSEGRWVCWPHLKEQDDRDACERVRRALVPH